MELAVAALGSLLPKLATLLTDEYKLQKGVRGEIRFLKAEMESMQAALDRVSKLPPQQIDDLHNIWVRDLKELSYDIEDSVDSFMLRVDAPGCAKPKSFRRFFDRTIGLLTKAKARHHIADASKTSGAASKRLLVGEKGTDFQKLQCSQRIQKWILGCLLSTKM